MRSLGRGKGVVVVLSKAYLESKCCMFELGEIAANGDFRNRVFPIVLPDARIYDSEDRLEYIRFWEQKAAALEAKMGQVGKANLQGINEDLNLYVNIRNTVAGLTAILGDMNTLTLEQHQSANFQDLRRALDRR